MICFSFQSLLKMSMRRDNQIFLWSSQLWVCRRKDPITGYVPKNYEKIIQAVKGQRKLKVTIFNPLLPNAAYMWSSAKISILIQEGVIKKNPISVAAMSL